MALPVSGTKLEQYPQHDPHMNRSGHDGMDESSPMTLAVHVFAQTCRETMRNFWHEVERSAAWIVGATKLKCWEEDAGMASDSSDGVCDSNSLDSRTDANFPNTKDHTIDHGQSVDVGQRFAPQVCLAGALWDDFVFEEQNKLSFEDDSGGGGNSDPSWLSIDVVFSNEDKRGSTLDEWHQHRGATNTMDRSTLAQCELSVGDECDSDFGDGRGVNLGPSGLHQCPFSKNREEGNTDLRGFGWNWNTLHAIGCSFANDKFDGVCRDEGQRGNIKEEH